MKNYNVLSTICLGIFFILFSLMINGVSFGSLGKIAIISMFLFPLFGAVLGMKGKKGIGKWVITILNLIALFSIGYILTLSGMGEA
ncbi:hypothetical protein LC048_11200 [Mesobacillus subterraneus]|uniref:hypothetical protein n=1 Tax=Mesobacillus subterraneus TaxID=285983 RepID=UPI001CFD0B8E|nr:hypothetical protein [Mesobacillus subterraneus]WLR57365.1 hypothetical protein LC048_11200 [Mesobacillus subterraneus]